MSYNSLFVGLIILIVSFALASCDETPPIENKKFIKIYSEMVFMQDTSSLSQSAIKNKVLKKFNIKEIEYDETIKYYNSDPERWQKFFDSTIVYLESLKPKPKKTDVKSLPKQSLSVDRKNP